MIAFHRVNKKSPLIIRIVDRIKINIVPYFLQIARFDIFYVCFVYFAAIAQVWIQASSVTCLLYSEVVKGGPSPTWLRKYQEEDEKEAVKRAIKESEILVT